MKTRIEIKPSKLIGNVVGLYVFDLFRRSTDSFWLGVACYVALGVGLLGVALALQKFLHRNQEKA